MNKKKQSIILIWLIAFGFIFLVNFIKIIPTSKYKIVKGVINDIQCIHPSKRYLQGEVQLFYGNDQFIKFQPPILKWDNFKQSCKAIKSKIKIGDHLEAVVYYEPINFIGDVYIDKRKIQDGKEIIESYNKGIIFFIYVILVVAVIITIIKIIGKKKFLNNKYIKRLFYFLGVWAIIKSLFNL